MSKTVKKKAAKKKKPQAVELFSRATVARSMARSQVFTPPSLKLVEKRLLGFKAPVMKLSAQDRAKLYRMAASMPEVAGKKHRAQ